MTARERAEREAQKVHDSWMGWAVGDGEGNNVSCGRICDDLKNNTRKSIEAAIREAVKEERALVDEAVEILEQPYYAGDWGKKYEAWLERAKREEGKGE